jgi:pimeloyl-ACP methyl ester carboxylesterase
MANVKVGDRNISYSLAEGDRTGRTVLLIHGATDNANIWAHQVEYLQSEHTPVTVNLPGRCGSDGPPINNNVDFRGFIKAFAEALGLPPFVICGHSMGGSISLDFARNHPDMLEGFIMVASSPKWDIPQEVCDQHRSDLDKALEGFGEMFSKHTPDQIKEQALKEARTVPGETGASDLEACGTYDLRNDLGGINVPALVTVGDEDDDQSLGGSRLAASSLPNVTFKLIQRSGHPIMLEQPEALNDLLGFFLKSL